MPNWELVFSIIQFLKEESKKADTDTQESLEVAIQCLQTAYDIDPNDKRFSSMPAGETLEQMFEKCHPKVNDKDAEDLKNKGNDMMRDNRPSDAIAFYTDAIRLDSRNAVYYCNRAAAYSKMNDFKSAISDCLKAIDCDPKYAKAYGRLGLAYQSLGKNEQAKTSFMTAVELDPSNETYRTNLATLEKESAEPPNMMNFGNLGGILRNAEFMRLATEVMSKPEVAQAFSLGANQDPTSEAGMENLLRAANNVASQVQNSSPELISQFRNVFSQFAGGIPEQGSPDEGGSKKEPPAS